MSAAPEPILINGRFLAQRETGVQRAAAEFVRALDGLRRDRDAPAPPMAILAPPDADPGRLDLRTIEIRRIGRLAGYAWEQWDLPLAARGSLLLNLGNVAPLTHRRNAILIHDASVFDRPEAYGRRFRTAMRWMLPRLAHRATALFTVSAFSADRLAHHGVTKAGGYTIAPNGVEHITRVEPDREAPARCGLLPGRYALFVGSPHPNKNLQGAFAAIEGVGDLSIRLVVVGTADPRVFDAPAAASGLRPDRVTFLGPVDDAALAGLYSGALALLFPSYYEGFGLPPLEAMALGCPVIASNRTAVPEVCGDAAWLVDPDDIAGMTAAIECLATDLDRRSEMIDRGRARARRFSWRASARRMTDVLARAGQPAIRSIG